MKTQLIITFSILSLVACKKNDTITTGKRNTASNTRAVNIAQISPANPANPFDSIGYLHNLILSDIQPCISSFSNPTSQEITGCIIPIAQKEHIDESGTPFNMVPIVVNDSPYDFIHIISNSNYSPQSKLLMYSLVNLVKTVAVNTGDYLKIKSAIVAFEAPIINNSTLAIDERQTLLSMTATARYSIYYWLHQVQPAGLSLKRFVMIVGTALTDAVSLAVTRNAGFSADSSEEAWWEMTYSIPGDM